MPAAAYRILPSSAWPHGGTDRIYLCIDLKSFYASVRPLNVWNGDWIL